LRLLVRKLVEGGLLFQLVLALEAGEKARHGEFLEACLGNRRGIGVSRGIIRRAGSDEKGGESRARKTCCGGHAMVRAFEKGEKKRKYFGSSESELGS
jgi:hypothetical protein